MLRFERCAICAELLEEERKKCAGRWDLGDDKYWLGYTDALDKALRLINGTQDHLDTHENLIVERN